MLVLAVSCAVPTISAAQDAGTTTDATTTTTATTPEPTPPPPTDPGNASQGNSPDKGRPSGGDKGGGAQAPTPAALPAESQPAVTVSSPSGKAHASASASVTMGDLFFSPTSVTVAVGDTVTWHNTGQAPHNATADDGSFKTPTLNNGQSASHTFSQAGTFSYICTIHPQMKGTIRVLSSSTGGGGGGGNGASSSSSSSSPGSESSAVASPNAAGNSSTLPMTGMAVGGLALVGLGLLALGLIARQADRERSRRRWLSIF
jgi:plastocyanin